MADPTLHVLAYLSSATTLPTQADLEDILVQARRNNEAGGITGLLLYHDGNFFQVLEGARDAVEACYSRIVADPRHRGHILLLSDSTADRRFADWSMAYERFSDLNAACQKGFLELRSIRDGDAIGAMAEDDEVAIFVKTFLDTLAGR